MSEASHLDAPTELAPGGDRLECFAAAAAASGATMQRSAAADVPAAVVSILTEHRSHKVSVANDLVPYGDAVRTACRDAGFDVDAYGEIVADRPRLASLDACVTGCAGAVAATGSIVTSSTAGRGSALVAPVHVCVVRADQIVDGLVDLFRALRVLAPGSMTALQTGPSRSADIEKVLVIGAHRPCFVSIVLVE